VLEYIKDDKGTLLGVLDFWVVDGVSGKLDDNGNCIFINEIYIDPGSRNMDMIPKFIDSVTKRVPQAMWGYFRRAKYNNRIRCYPKYKWLKVLRRQIKMEVDNV